MKNILLLLIFGSNITYCFSQTALFSMPTPLRRCKWTRCNIKLVLVALDKIPCSALMLPNGANPNGGLTICFNDGLLYGMTDSGGVFNFGVIFNFDPITNAYTKLHDFDSLKRFTSPW